MWSKLLFLEEKLDFSEISKEASEFETVLNRWSSEIGRVFQIERLNLGTLGIVFKLSSDKEVLIAKWNGDSPRAQRALEWEFEIMNFLYSEIIWIDKIYCNSPNLEFLIMDYLSPDLLHPDQVYLLQSDFNHKLKRLELFEKIPDYLNLKNLCARAFIAADEMLQSNILDSALLSEIQSYLRALAGYVENVPREICHGDLGPKNILFRKRIPIAIDWEDVFWGIRDYDYLYWLTFLENRKFYSTDVLDHVSHPLEISQAIMLMVVVLKEDLARRSGISMQGRLPVSERVIELLQICK